MHRCNDYCKRKVKVKVGETCKFGFPRAPTNPLIYTFPKSSLALATWQRLWNVAKCERQQVHVQVHVQSEQSVCVKKSVLGHQKRRACLTLERRRALRCMLDLLHTTGWSRSDSMIRSDLAWWLTFMEAPPSFELSLYTLYTKLLESWNPILSIIQSWALSGGTCVFRSKSGRSFWNFLLLNPNTLNGNWIYMCVNWLLLAESSLKLSKVEHVVRAQDSWSGIDSAAWTGQFPADRARRNISL